MKEFKINGIVSRLADDNEFTPDEMTELMLKICRTVEDAGFGMCVMFGGTGDGTIDDTGYLIVPTSELG